MGDDFTYLNNPGNVWEIEKQAKIHDLYLQSFGDEALLFLFLLSADFFVDAGKKRDLFV